MADDKGHIILFYMIFFLIKAQTYNLSDVDKSVFVGTVVVQGYKPIATGEVVLQIVLFF